MICKQRFHHRDPPSTHYSFLPCPYHQSPLINCPLFCLVHSLDQSVNEGLAVAMVTSLNVVPCLLSVASTCIAQLKRPEEVVCLLEVGPNSDYLMDEVFNTDDAVLAENLFKFDLKKRGKLTINSWYQVWGIWNRKTLNTSNVLGNLLHKQCFFVIKQTCVTFLWNAYTRSQIDQLQIWGQNPQAMAVYA